MELNLTDRSLSAEECKKAEFLKRVENILQQLNHGQINVSQGYQQLMELLGENEMEAVLQVLYNKGTS